MFYSDMMAKNANFKICYAYVSGLSSLRYKRECVCVYVLYTLVCIYRYYYTYVPICFKLHSFVFFL